MAGDAGEWWVRGSHELGQRPRGSRLDVWRAAALVIGTLVVHQLSAPRPSRAQGFQESIAMSGLTNPTAIEFAADGRVFVAEKSGIIKVFDSLSDTTPTIFADLRTKVYNFWDRGLLGLALHPNFPTQPYVYVLYTHDAAIGGTAPRWGAPGVTSDPCPNPPGATGDGCVASGRLSRLQAAGNVMTGSEVVLIEDWFQQYPSHSVGHLAFGSDGALYVSAGDGASFNFVDYGQDGNPLNPGGDPPVGVGGVQTPPTAEGGALRSQDLRTGGDPVTLDGTILRVHPDTGAGMPDNPFAGSSNANTRRIIAYGLRNPFRFAPRPGTNEIWVADVGWGDWEEINRIVDPRDTSAENFGWPCYEGGARQAGYDAANLNICEQLYATPGAVTGPFFTYHHTSQVVPGDTGPTGGSSITGLAFYNGGSYPAAYVGALFFADYTRNGIWVMFRGANGVPDPATRATFVASATNPVELQIGPGGDLFYVNLIGGTIRRIQYLSSNQPPTANAGPDQTATPGQQVTLNGTGSTDPNGNPLTYLWTQTGGPAVTLSSPTVAQPTFTAPTVTSSTTLTFQLVVNDGQSSSLPDTVRIVVTAAGVDLTDLGTTIARVPNPTGGGNHNLEVIRDGDKPPVGNQDSSRQYDTFDGANQAAEDWIGYDYGTTLHAFGRVVFQEGGHFADGGWFETLTVQVRQNGVWASVPGLLTITPAYPGINNGVTYETYALSFNPVAADAIRIYGPPGGTNDFISVGELEVFASGGPNTPPSATISAPAATVTWQVAEVITFSGGATDTQDGQLPSSGLSWSLILHHCTDVNDCHQHPLQDFPGVAGGSFAAPDHEYPAHLELRLTATDSGGLTDTASVQLDPRVAVLTFQSSPSGLQLAVGSGIAPSPFNRMVIVGSTSSISAPSPQTLGGTTYAFTSWSDGGAQSHNITAGASPATYVASYGAVPTIFGTATGYPTGSETHGVATGDFDADGRLDLVAANHGSSNVSVLRGNGNGTFQAAVNYAVGLGPKSVHVGDFNNDGRSDLVSANQEGDSVSVLLGNGNATFQSRVDYPICSRGHEAAIGDLNGDGRQDLAVACWNGSVISVLLGNGNGTFQTAVNYPAGSGPHSIVAGDFHGDGPIDLAVANHSDNNVTVLRGNGNGTFQAPVSYAVGVGPHSLRTADLNFDGRLDLAVVDDGSHDARVLLNNGNGTFGPASSYPTGSVPKGIGLGDVNGDGVPDLVATNTAGSYPVCCQPGGDKVSVLLGNGDGTFAAQTTYTVGLTPFAVAIADLNGDGLRDLATANWHSNNVTVLLNQIPPGATTTTTLAPPTTTTTITATTTTTTTSTTLGGGGLPAPWTSGDVGATGIAGSASFSNGTFTVNGSGADIWGSADAFHFVRQPWSGDGRITARVTGVENTSPWAKAGVMMRATLAANSAHAMMMLTPGFGWAFQSRASTGGSSVHTAGGAATAPTWVRLTRTGNTITAEVSSNGVTWAPGGSASIPLGASISVGLAVTAHDNSVLSTATFDNVSVTTLAPATTTTTIATTTTTLAPATTTTTIGTTTTTLAPPTTTTTITTTTTSTTSTTLGGGGLPAPWTTGDVGATGIAGSASYASGTFTVNGSGADIWGSADAFHFVRQPWSGDGRITARVTSVENTSPWAKAGVMMRATLAANSAHAMVVLTPGFGWAFQSRASTGSGSVHTAGGAATAPTWVRLTRTGNTITAEVSSNGVTWAPGGSTSIPLGASISVGLAVTAHSNSAVTTATFDNVSVQ